MAKRGNILSSNNLDQKAIDGNGHGPGLLRPGAIEALLKDSDMPNAARELVHPGKEPIELLMRCYFDDEREVNAAVLYLSKCEEFDDDEGKKVLLWKMAAKTSIKGRARFDLLQALTGQLKNNGPDYQVEKKQKEDDET